MFRDKKEEREFWERNRPSMDWPLVIGFAVLGILAVVTAVGLILKLL